MPSFAAMTCSAAAYEAELEAAGVRIVLYANHLLRAAYPAMARVARSILSHGRAQEAEAHCMSVTDALAIVASRGWTQ